MSISRELLERYSCDPQLLQRVVIETIESANNGEVVLNDPTNPFTMLLEAATTLSSNSILEAKSIIRKKYPSLALAADELYHHITDDHLKSITSQPAECNIIFYVSILDLRLQGNRPKNANYGEIIIPIGTKVTIINTTLTLLNNIRVRLYDNGNVLVEQENNDNPLAYADVGIIESSTWTSNNGTPFIRFSAKMKQLTKKSYNYSIISSQGFSKVLSITDKFHNAIVSYKNANTGGNYRYINKSFNDDYIDPLSLTCFVSLYDSNILFRIPDMYITSGLLSGNVNIDIYETRGKLYEPLYRYKIEEDFSLTLGDTGSSAAAAAAKNVLIWVHSDDILQGGSDGLSTYELRDEVIDAVVGDMEMPITEKQISKLASEYGYSLVKSIDVLTERLYLGMKPLPEFNSELLYSRMDCLFSNFTFKLNELKNSNFVVTTETKGSNTTQLILKSKSLFEYSSEGFVIISDDDEYKRIEKLSKEKLIEELKERQLYFNPFYYVIKESTDITTCDVLDLDNPEVLNRRIVGKNVYFNERVNTSKNGIWKTEYGYRFAFNVAVDNNYEALTLADKGFQVRVKLTTAESYAYWDAKYDKTNEWWYIDIYTDLEYSDGSIRIYQPKTSDGALDKTNCVSALSDFMYMSLSTEFDIYAYTISNSFNDTTAYLKNELWTFNATVRYTVFTKETFSVKIGEELKWIYNKIWSSYETIVQRYTEDKELVYAEDQYELTKNGLKLWYNTDTNKLEYKIIHKKGDVVLDSGGEKVLAQKKGEPVNDEESNLEYRNANAQRTMSLLLFEYPYLKATNSVYVEYLSQMTKTLNQYITDELDTINDKLLEKTQVVFKSSKSIMDTIITINNSLFYTNFYVKPKITIYSTSKTNYSTEDQDGFRVTLGNILTSYFNKLTIKLEEIRTEMKTALGTDIASVKIENIEASNAEVITVNSELNKFVLRKKLDFDTNKELIVKYDIDIEVVYI